MKTIKTIKTIKTKIMKNLEKFITYISIKLYGKQRSMWSFQ